jgi:hypothetical protein
LLDAVAKKQYQDRLQHIDEELKTAANTNDLETVESLEEERTFLIQQLGQAVGLRGRDRWLDPTAERDRKSVGEAISNTLERIRRLDSALADYLHEKISGGSDLVYRDEKTEWKL